MVRENENPLLDQYRRIHSDAGSILESSLGGDLALLHGKSNSFLSDFDLWINILRPRLEVSALENGLREYQFALLALVQGFYSQAFMSLRLFLELSLGVIHLTANELQLRLWLSGSRDLNWSEIIDDNNGIFSNNYMNAFCPQLIDEARHNKSMASKLYRECSEYVHGNPSSLSIIPDELIFSEDLFRDWHSKADICRLIINFVLISRYLCILTRDQLGKLERPLLDELGHLKLIRTIYDQPEE